ncbi:hypothetical protein BJV82DRAFT_715351 [Fennellomyces sp. T-0311]|nr:hypothetical protein BJV82DRAFT_715351 [Fennellomyces sp. T-0311]
MKPSNNPFAESCIMEKTEVPASSDEKYDHTPSSTAPPSIDPESIYPPKIQEQNDKSPTPNKSRLALRIWQTIAAPGTFILQASASAYANHDPPSAINVALLYFVYGVCSASFIWSSFMIYVYFTRRFGTAGKVKRAVTFAVDTFFAVLVGIGVSSEIGMYKCPPGELDGWCDLFNTGIFFGVSLFVTYVAHSLWTIFSSLSFIRETPSH